LNGSFNRYAQLVTGSGATSERELVVFGVWLMRRNAVEESEGVRGEK
jgi:hypothetical protein